MANEDAKVSAKITAKDEASSVFDATAKRMEDRAKRLQESLDGLKKGFGIVGAAAAAVGVAVVKLTRDGLEYGDTISKMSQKLGLATETLSVLAYQGELAGVELTGMANAMKFLIVNLSQAQREGGESAEAFFRLGLSAKDYGTSAREQSRLLGDVAQAFKGMADGGQKAELAVKLFGRAGLDMIPLLNEGAEGFARAEREARSFGLVISAEQGRRIEKFNDDITRLTSSLKGLGVELAILTANAVNLDRVVQGVSHLRMFFNIAKARVFGVSDEAKAQYESEKAGFRDVADYKAYLEEIAKTNELFGQSIDAGSPLGPDAAAAFYKGRENAAKIDAFNQDTRNRYVSSLLGRLGEDYQALIQYAQDFYEWQERIAAQAKARDFGGGIKTALAEARAEFDDWHSRGRDLTRDFLRGVNADWDQLFLHAMEQRLFRVQDLFGVVARNIQRLLAKQAADNLTSLFTSGLQGLFGNSASPGYTPSTPNVEPQAPIFTPEPEPRAGGGPVRAGERYVVGERRPELFIPGRDGHIVPDARGGGGNTFNINVNAVDAKSFFDLASSNPEAFAVMVVNVISTNPQIAQAMRGALS